MKQLQIKIFFKNQCTCTCMFVGIKNFTGPWLFGSWHFEQSCNMEHQPRLEWQLVSIFVFLQTVMVKEILQKIRMQHFSIKWFDILNLHLVSINLLSKDIKNYFACFSFRTINRKARFKQITGSLSKWPKTLLTAQLELPFPMYVQYLRGPFISLVNY